MKQKRNANFSILLAIFLGSVLACLPRAGAAAQDKGSNEKLLAAIRDADAQTARACSDTFTVRRSLSKATCDRVTVIFSGDRLAIEFRDSVAIQEFDVQAGQVDWDEPTSEVHRAINVGRRRYEEVVTYFLSEPGQDPHPIVELTVRSLME